MTKKFILLDMDGVMVPATSWKPIDVLPDGFYKFNSSLHDLPPEVKSNWVKTQPMIGFNKEALEQALEILT